MRPQSRRSVDPRPVDPRSARLVATAFATAVAALVLMPIPTASGHDGDLKMRDRQRPVRGPVWREVDQGDGGTAGAGFTSSGIVLKAWFPLNTFASGVQNGNSCWGWVSPNGREYAIMGLSNGTGFVDITDPGASVIKSFQPGVNSLWRDVRTHGHYCYAASEGGAGIQVFDMSKLDSLGITTLVRTVDTPSGSSGATHTLAIDNESGYLYRAGGGGNGLRMYSLADPSNPTYVGIWSDFYVHEAQVKTYTSGPYAGKQIAFCFSGLNNGWASPAVRIVDVTNKANPVILSTTTYPGARYCHQGWLDEEARYLYINDELDEGNTVATTTTIVMDVSNLSAPVVAGTFTNGNTAVGHNIYVKGTKIYEANYRSGIRIFDAAVDRVNPPEIAWFDTYPGSDSANFNGLWNIWPYFPSGTVIGSDIERGLFVWREVVRGDINADGFVNAADLGALLAAWGTVGGTADLNGDGLVGAQDLSILLAAWN
ncbi:MAG: choice-of-anchor B family protein [bacterium]|jgi:choice-of-anchor B domain-containing protein